MSYAVCFPRKAIMCTNFFKCRGWIFNLKPWVAATELLVLACKLLQGQIYLLDTVASVAFLGKLILFDNGR